MLVLDVFPQLQFCLLFKICNELVVTNGISCFKWCQPLTKGKVTQPARSPYLPVLHLEAQAAFG